MPYTASRYLTVLASFAVVLEVFFFMMADYHIASKSKNQRRGGGAFLPSPEEYSSSSSSSRRRFRLRRRQQQQKSIREDTQKYKKYTPDYSKFNTSLPPVLRASSPGSLPSLPEANRIPQNVLLARNFTEHYSNWTHTVDPPTLFVYNPSIVPLFPLSSSSSTQSVSDEEMMMKPQYLSTFRLSSIHSCGFDTYEFWKHPIDYVGLALLDDDLNIATTLDNDDSLDIIVDINANLRMIFQRPRLKFQDVRLFILHDRVFMSSGPYLIPICITVDGIGTTTGESLPISSPAICKNNNPNDNHQLQELPALYRKNNRLRLFVSGDAIVMKDTEGKNFQFFHINVPYINADNVATNKIMMEYWPQGPRVVHDVGYEIAKVDSKEDKNKYKQQKEVVPVMRMNEITSDFTPNPISKVARSLDSSLTEFIKRDRSSACCVQIGKEYYEDLIVSLPHAATELKVLDSVLLGISHSKSRSRMASSQGHRYNYLSRLYAFSTVEPYQLVARSGLFCFGFPNEKDTKRNDIIGNGFNEFTKGKKLEINWKSHDCPNVHFVVSMIEKESDKSKLIVSYGVNDCVPRFLEMSKRHAMIHLLFSNETAA